MGRSYLGYREYISTSLQARSRLAMKYYEKLHCVHMRRKVFPGTEISLADRRDLGDRDNICPNINSTFPLGGKTSVYTLQNLHQSGKLYW